MPDDIDIPLRAENVKLTNTQIRLLCRVHDTPGWRISRSNPAGKRLLDQALIAVAVSDFGVRTAKATPAGEAWLDANQKAVADAMHP